VEGGRRRSGLLFRVSLGKEKEKEEEEEEEEREKGVSLTFFFFFFLVLVLVGVGLDLRVEEVQREMVFLGETVMQVRFSSFPFSLSLTISPFFFFTRGWRGKLTRSFFFPQIWERRDLGPSAAAEGV